ncbi:MAG: transcriptional regulator NrdR [Firmicutes bacterium]|nr:transcriptional regulator NrdR [Bacillota bacterium]
MKCPYCACEDSKVIDSRPTDDSERIRRRRECSNCAKRFTTYEIIETVPLMVIKKDKSRESFDRQKLFNSLRRACDKRAVSVDDLESVVSDIEQALHNSMEREIPTEKIGELAMEHLKQLDEVSYVRFASVYREFKDLHSFMDELAKLLREKK